MLAERLRELIRARGPIAFRDWMEAALYDSEFGYYTRIDRKRWGREGDYRTSAERSELFAATFARYFARLYDELGTPSQWTILEGGSGDGTFARRVQHALKEDYPRVFEVTHYLTSEILNVEETIHSLNPCLYFSNELLDAFPVHRVVSEGELYVTLDSGQNFIWSVGPYSTPRLNQFLEEHSIKLIPGQTIEINLAIDDWLSSVVAKIKRGYVVTVDYGAEAADLYDPSLRPDGTLRAFSRHGFVANVLSAPGEYDITSSVNWTQVKATGERLGLRVVEFDSQDRFLRNAGLLDVLERRLRRMEKASDQLRLTTDAREMILPGGMGSSFQVLVLKRG
ncbi:MAG TPA: SAM-dependent methyltransferase [Pyrinomonadaceae bacterium]|nr:SAM-dependent methyltransferase [Pyrinomonadaceae bacterium]